MEKLTKNDRLKIEILKQYKKKNISYTASYLSRILKSKFETTKKALDFFEIINILHKEVKEHGEKEYIYYDLTEIGKTLINMKKSI